MATWNCLYFSYSSLYFALVYIVQYEVNCATIPWPSSGTNSPSSPTSSSSSSSSETWYFQRRNSAANGQTKFYASDKLPVSSSKCQEPYNLPEQLLAWYSESTSDYKVITLKRDEKMETSTRSSNSLITESDDCAKAPSIDQNASIMDRALCPWEWRLNRDENREPKLISEARCLCSRSRGPVMVADCIPIQREFPVLRRVRCDEQGKYQYVKGHEIITVGCHSVMPRVTRGAQPPPWMMRAKEV